MEPQQPPRFNDEGTEYPEIPPTLPPQEPWRGYGTQPLPSSPNIIPGTEILPPTPKPRRFSWVWIAGICIAVAAAIGVFAYFILGGEEEKTKDNPYTPIHTQETTNAEDLVPFHLEGYMESEGGIRKTLTIKGDIDGLKIKNGEVKAGDKRYKMIGEIMENDTYRLICTSSQDDMLVINIFPTGGRFEGDLTTGTSHYEVVLQ